MYTFRITFKNEDGKKKSVKVDASGMIPAIELGIHKFYNKNSMFGWELVKAELIIK